MKKSNFASSAGERGCLETRIGYLRGDTRAKKGEWTGGTSSHANCSLGLTPQRERPDLFRYLDIICLADWENALALLIVRRRLDPDATLVWTPSAENTRGAHPEAFPVPLRSSNFRLQSPTHRPLSFRTSAQAQCSEMLSGQPSAAVSAGCDRHATPPTSPKRDFSCRPSPSLSKGTGN